MYGLRGAVQDTVGVALPGRPAVVEEEVGHGGVEMTRLAGSTDAVVLVDVHLYMYTHVDHRYIPNDRIQQTDRLYEKRTK